MADLIMAHRVFTAEYRQSAISLVIDQNYTPRESALLLGSGLTTIEHRLKQPPKRNGLAADIEANDLRRRVAELEKENQRLTLEREILEKSAAFFAKVQP